MGSGKRWPCRVIIRTVRTGMPDLTTYVMVMPGSGGVWEGVCEGGGGRGWSE